MSHYFNEEQEVSSRKKEIEVIFRDKAFYFVTDSGVFSGDRLDHGSKVLLKGALDHVTEPALDLGCGYGAVGVIVSRLLGIEVDLSDVNRRALELAKENVKKNRAKGNVFYSDGFSSNEKMYRSILLNPPIRAGKEVVYRLFRESYEHLLPGGKLFIVIQKKQGLSSARDYLLTFFESARTLEKSAGFHVLELSKAL